MSRIYLVQTPQGDRLVEANTKGQAINHCIAGDYLAEPVSAAEMHQRMQSGARVEKAVVAKKLDGDGIPSTGYQAKDLLGGSTSQQTPDVNFGVVSPDFLSPSPAPTTAPGTAKLSNAPGPIVSSAPNAVPNTANAALPPQGSIARHSPIGAVAPEGWQPPQHAPAVNPVLAEQQRINPEAATRAGVVPILERVRAAAPPAAPEEWQDRAVRPAQQG